MTIGIYKLNFDGGRLHYIGQSIDIQSRFTSHRTSLKRGLSPYKLQEAYNLYGFPNLEILVECTVEELNDLEELAISLYNSNTSGLNTMSKFGHRSILKGDSCGNSKYSNELVTEAFMYLVTTNLTHLDIQEITGMTRGALSNISAGNTHKWLKDVYPEEYEVLLNRKDTRRKDSISRVKGGSRVLNQYPEIIDPNGNRHTVEHLREFCRQHNLNHGSLGELLRGHKSQYKGWKLITE